MVLAERGKLTRTTQYRYRHRLSGHGLLNDSLDPRPTAGMQSTLEQTPLSPSFRYFVTWAEDWAKVERRRVGCGCVEVVARSEMLFLRIQRDWFGRSWELATGRDAEARGDKWDAAERNVPVVIAHRTEDATLTKSNLRQGEQSQTRYHTIPYPVGDICH